MKIGWILFVIGIFCLKSIKLEPVELTLTKADTKSTITSETTTVTTESPTVDVESSGPIQILTPNGNFFKYVENNRLEKILSSDKLKDHYIVVISIVGDVQTGKSFLLNIFLKYLRSNQKLYSPVNPISSTNSLDSSDWLSTDISNGFESKLIEHGQTKGVWAWPEIFTHSFTNGDKLAILLLDTEGMHEINNDLAHDTAIFTLSTLSSSMQFYNYKSGMKIDNQVFEPIKKFGEFAMSENSEGVGKPFQSLKFVIRDFSYPTSDAEKTKDILDLPEVNETQPYYSDPFQALTLPQPAIGFDGDILHASEKFKEKIQAIVLKLLSPDKLLIKDIFGQQIKAKDIMTYFKEYAAIFTDGTPSEPSTIFKITAKLTNSQIRNTSLELYESLMKGILSETIPPYYKPDAFQEIHNQSKKESINKFDNEHKVGGESWTKPIRDMLLEDIEKEFAKFSDINEQKRIAYFENSSKNIRDEFEQTVYKEVNQTDPNQINSTLATTLLGPLKTEFLQKFNTSGYNNDTDVSATAYKDLNDYFSKYKSDFTQSLKLYNESAEAYVSSMNDLFKDRKYYDETELLKEHQGAKERAIKAFGDDVRCDDQIKQYPQILKCDKLGEFIENNFNAFKMMNSNLQTKPSSDSMIIVICVVGIVLVIGIGIVSIYFWKKNRHDISIADNSNSAP